MCQTEILSKVHAQGDKTGYPFPDLCTRESLRLLTFVPEVEANIETGQISRITCTKQAGRLNVGDRVAIGKGDNRVYTIGTVMNNTEGNEISIRYDYTNPVGVAVDYLGQGQRMLTWQEFDTIFIKLIRGY